MGERYEMRVDESQQEYPFIVVDNKTGEVVDAFPSRDVASARLADYRGEYRQDEYGDN